MTILEQARIYRKAILTAVPSLNDEIASTSVQLFPTLAENGSLVKAGTRINWKGALKRAAVDVWDTVENNPDNAPTLWEDIAYKDGFRIIPEIITATLSFAKGECGWWGDTLYKSKIDANVYTPIQHSGGWEIVMRESRD